MSFEILEGDCREMLRQLEAESVQCCVTSPPYWGLRDYGLEAGVWGGESGCDHEWGTKLVRRESNYGERKRWQHDREEAGAPPEQQRAGWRRQEVQQGRFCQRCGAWEGCLGLEPHPDLYVDHLVEIFAEVWRVLRSDGTLWLNLGDCFATGAGRVGEAPGGGAQGESWRGNPQEKQRPKGPVTQPNRMPIEGLKAKDLVGVPWRAAFALQAWGWWLRSEIIWAKPNPMPESVRDRPTSSHEQIFLLAKDRFYHYDRAAILENDGGVASGNGFDRGEHRLTRGGEGQEEKWTPGGGRNRRDVWEVMVRPFPEAHFATFPPKLIEPCILAGAPEGATVLDPFSGAGTTLLVAEQRGRDSLGIEQNPEYAEMARDRIRRWRANPAGALEGDPGPLPGQLELG